MKFNPYHQWLGLDPRLTRPHYFQLLQLTTKFSDVANFRSDVEAAAAKKLELLKRASSQPGSDPAIVEKLEQQIHKARTVLSHDGLREQYLAKLRSQIAAKKPEESNASATDPALLKSTSAKRSSDLAGPTLDTNRDLLPPRFPANPAPASNSPPPMAVPVSPSAEALAADVPLAIALPVGPNLNPSPQPNISADLNSTFPPTESSEPELPIRINKKVVKSKSRSGLLVALTMLLLTAGIAGGAFWYLKLIKQQQLQLIQGSESQQNQLPSSVVNNPANETAESSEPSPLSDTNPTDPLATAPEWTDPSETESEEGAKNENEATSNDKMVSEQPVRSKKKRNEKTIAPPIALTDVEQIDFRRRVELFRLSLLRCDADSAKRQMKTLENKLKQRLGQPPTTLVPEQQQWESLIAALPTVAKNHDGFWQQVVNSANNIPGGQDITIGEQTLAFVESSDAGVVLKNAGSIIQYDYSFLLPGLAVAVAEQGAIPDMPTWRLQLALFYGLNQDEENDYSKKIESLVEQSTVDGHDPAWLQTFLDSADMDWLNQDRIELPTRETVEQSLAAFRSSANYQAPQKIDPKTAGDLAMQLLDTTPISVEQAASIMIETRELAVRAGDANLVQDALLELNRLADIDLTVETLDSLIEIANQKLSANQARKLVEVAIPFLKTEKAKTLKPREVKNLFGELMRLAKKFEFADSVRRLSQL